jgi:hypothetical protein
MKDFAHPPARSPVLTDETRPRNRRPLISHQHRKRSLTTWLLPLAVIVAIMVFLPRLVALLEQ